MNTIDEEWIYSLAIIHESSQWRLCRFFLITYLSLSHFFLIAYWGLSFFFLIAYLSLSYFLIAYVSLSHFLIVYLMFCRVLLVLNWWSGNRIKHHDASPSVITVVNVAVRQLEWQCYGSTMLNKTIYQQFSFGKGFCFRIKIYVFEF